MSVTSDRLKWIGIWLLQLPAYMILSYVMRWIIGAFYNLCIRAGAQLPSGFLLQHLLRVGMIGGFLAGLVGYAVVSAMLFLPRRRAVTGDPLSRPQAWTWVLPTCWMLLGVLEWVTGSAHPSVLASSGVSISNIVETFFGRACSLGGSTWDVNIISSCMQQITYSHFWLGTIGYSAAAFVSPTWIQVFKKRTAPPGFLSEDQHHEEIES